MQASSLILWLDSSLDEAIRIQADLIGAGVHNPFYAFQQVGHARQYLSDALAGGDAPPLPRLVVLRFGGGSGTLELIQFIRSERLFRDVRVLVLAGSADPELLRSALDSGAESVYYERGDRRGLAAAVRLLLEDDSAGRAQELPGDVAVA